MALQDTDVKLENVLAILGALVPLASALASFLNHMVREKQARGERVSPVLLSAGSMLNVASINLDKAVQLGKMVRGSAAPAPASSQPPAADPTVSDAPVAPTEKCPTCGAPKAG